MPFDLTWPVPESVEETSYYQHVPENQVPITEVPTTPSIPKSPDISLAKILARDNAEKQWYKLLTHKQRLFVCALFGNGFDVVAATKEIVPTLTTTEARAKGAYWYALPKVRNAIEALFAYYQESTKVRWEDLITELRTVAFANIMDFYEVSPNGDPELRLPKNPTVNLKAIAEINVEYTRFGQKSRIKMHDKMGAIDRLIKLLQPSAGAGDGASIVVQNINIIPVPQGQFLPAPVINEQPLIDVTPVKSTAKPTLTVVP